MVGKLLLRGMLVGIVAGLLSFGFAKVFGEPSVDRAIAFEAQMEAAKGEAPEEELVSRDVQAGPGLLVGTVIFGAAIGGLFALVFAYAYGRLGALGARGTAALVALTGFAAVILIPFIKYPANPPSVGHPETIGQRTALYFIMMAISVIAMFNAVVVARKLTHRWGLWNGAIIAGLAYVVLIGVAQLILPSINEVPENFSAVLLWQFRLSALGTHAVLWASLGLLFGVLTERSFAAKHPAGRLALKR
ncbi:MAG TPA: CbtA family protein [Terriglobales bacterium]|nr:CbtA family protein [Terriglobales bacterium]